jgi:hypothetical protein
MLEAACRRNELSSALFAPHAVRQLAASTLTHPAASREAWPVASTEARLDPTPNVRCRIGFDALVWDIEVILI